MENRYLCLTAKENTLLRHTDIASIYHQMKQEYKYYAFISYSSKDTSWGKELQRKLENYRMPSTLCQERGWDRKPIKPVFFAPTDIQPGGLNEELQERLRASRNLIVVCSPHSARSEWVGREIEFFHQLGRTDHIHFFIVDGKPHSGDPETECFNPMVDKLGLPEILGANIHEQVFRWPWLNKERAYVQLISKLLGVEFDTIWQRHRRLLIQKAVGWGVGLIAVLAIVAGVWLNSQPVDVEVRLNETTEHNDQLPPLKDAVVTMTMDNESKTDTITDLQLPASFPNIPHRFLDKEVQVSVVCDNCLRLDTTLTLTRQMVLPIRRDAQVYGDIRFRLWNPNTERFVPNTSIQVDGQSVATDAEGNVRLTIPLSRQKPFYIVTAPLPLASDTLFMPCGESDVISLR
jgi:hypothetical protein